MKKLLLLLTLLMTLCAASALADEIPAEIEKLFSVATWEDYTFARVSANPEEYAFFLCDEGVIIGGEPLGMVIMKKGDRNVLCVLQKRSGQWRITGRSHTALPEGDVIPQLHFDLQDDIDLIYGSTPVRGIHTISLKYNGRTVRFSGMVVGEGLDTTEAIVLEEGIRYVFSHDLAYAGSQTVYGVFDASFEAFNYRDFPKSPAEADAVLTFAPDIPRNSGDPNALPSPQEPALRSGEKYDVFSAPGRDSYRPANGKAVMSTNDWVQVFGVEDGWVLVQYDISSGQMRFGYVDASVLPRGVQVPQLTWAEIPYEITAATCLTDDPLNSCKVLMQLQPGEQVTVLATMGQWLYVETTLSGKDVRGFIPMEAATPLEPEDGWDALYPNG
ncbi:MAG: hypothetical protein IJE07_03560 [Clostridia bacterium]|nr:hypothetical protein [Clostridia bacterium]